MKKVITVYILLILMPCMSGETANIERSFTYAPEPGDIVCLGVCDDFNLGSESGKLLISMTSGLTFSNKTKDAIVQNMRFSFYTKSMTSGGERK